MRFINAGLTGRAAELDNLWALLATIDQKSYIIRATGGPRSAVLSPMNPDFAKLDKKNRESLASEFYDRYCHKQDRSYSIPELFHWLQTAGLHFAGLNGPTEKFRLSIRNIVLRQRRIALENQLTC